MSQCNARDFVRCPARVVTGLALVLSLPAGAQENLVANPGFEQDEDGNGMPDRWSFSWKKTKQGDTDDMDRQEPDWAWDDADFHDGARSVRVGVQRSQDDGVWTQDGIILPEGVKIFRLSGWFKVESADSGTADLAVVFQGEDNRWLGADYACIHLAQDTPWKRLVGLFKSPEGTHHLRLRFWVNFRRKGPITAWADDVSIEPTELEELPPLTHLDPTPMPELSAEDRERGFVPFAANYLDVLMPAIVPTAEQLDASLAVFAAPGEREPVSFAVRALRDIKDLSASISPLKGDKGGVLSDAVQTGVVRCIVRKVHPRTSDMLLLPAFIEPMHPVDVPADTSQWFWFTAHVPEDAAPDIYRGTITVSGDGASVEIPVQLEVLPIELMQPPGISWGMYDDVRTYSDAADALEEKWRDQAEHGMTSVGLCGNLGAEMEMRGGRGNGGGNRPLAGGGEVVVAWTGETDFERAMAAYQAAGFTEPVQWLMGRDVSKFAAAQGAMESQAYADAYAGVIRAVLARAQERGWPEIIFQPVDEAFEHRPRFEQMMREMQILKDLGVKVEADGMNGKPEGIEEALPYMDYLNFHDGPFLRRGTYDAEAWQQFRQRMESLGKTIWFYNVEISGHRPENARFSQGFHLWLNGAKGAFTWSYRSIIPDPYGLNPKRKFVFMHRYPPMGDEVGGPSIGFEALREGIDDYRYLYTWERLCEKALAEGYREQKATAKYSRRWLAAKLAEIDYSKWNGWPTQGEWTGGEQVTDEGGKAIVGHLKVPGVWDLAEYDSIRRQLADFIIDMQ